MGKRKRVRKRDAKSGRRRVGKGKRSRARNANYGRRLADLAIIAMLLLAVYFAIFGGEYTVFELRRLEALEKERAAELARTEAEIDSLQKVARHLRDDPAEIERVARERYGMIREGEILYRFREAPERDGDAIDANGKRE